MGALGVYIGLPPRGTMVNRLGAGPSHQSLRLPASLPIAGACWLVGPTDWSGTELTGRTRRLRALLAADHCRHNANDTGLVGEAWLQSRRLVGDHCCHSVSHLVDGAWGPREGLSAYW